MGRHSLWLPLGLLLFLGVVSAWLNYTVRNAVTSGTRNETDPETIIENFQAVRTDVQGRITERLSAQKLSHFSGSLVSELEQPDLVQYAPGVPDLNAVAGHATIMHDNRQVVLDRNVVVTRAATPGASAMVLRTQRLLLFPQQHLARAPGPVSVDGDALSVNANGLVADSNYRTLKFAGRVKARYLTPSSPAAGKPHAHAKPE
jgi:lipopolysaccharide export system protein LptC